MFLAQREEEKISLHSVPRAVRDRRLSNLEKALSDLEGHLGPREGPLRL